MNKKILKSSLAMATLCILTGLFPLTVFGAETTLRMKVAPPPPSPADLKVSVAFVEPSGNRALDADETGEIHVTVKNKGPGTAHGVTLRPTILEGGKDIALSEPIRLGDIAPGKEIQKSIPLKAGHGAATGTLRLKIETVEANGFDGDPVTMALPTRKFEPPRLVIADMGIQDFSQNGQVEPAETIEVIVRIQNSGKGPAKNAQAIISLGPNVLPGPDFQREVPLGDLQPGGAQDVRFSFLTNRRVQPGEKIPISLILTCDAADRTEAPLDLVMNRTQRRAEEVVIQAKKTPGQQPAPQPGDSLSIDVERDIPQGKAAGPFDVAVVIANGHYAMKGVPHVAYAYRDAGVMKEYLIRTFGLKPENIIEARDATKGTFETLFGGSNDPRGKLHAYVKPGKSRVFIYYVGHGAPSPETGEGYFVPTDADPDYISKSGYPLSVFYANLKALPAKELVVVLDACFSGRTQEGFLFKNVSPGMLRVKETAAGLQRGAVLASSQGDQMSTWYPAKQHSLFTYYFLKGLQGEADADQNKSVTVGEMGAYLSEHVPYWAGRLAGKRQEPKMEGNPDLVLVRFK